ncbi:MAG TPA: hypothetical protein VFJ77_05595 [Gaiellaceae bacterium]|nr:hypothetical protein [Gaiellaceae bacterium]
MSGYRVDRAWSDRFVPELKRIAGEHLIGEAPEEEDRERGTDLIVLRLEPVRIACRVRRPAHLVPYGHQFTIRTSRPSGARTELRKIVAGWGDYLLFGFADRDEQHLAQWFLGDLNVFREWRADEQARTHREPGTLRTNPDGTRFRAYGVDDLPAGFVVARSAPTWQERKAA